MRINNKSLTQKSNRKTAVVFCFSIMILSFLWQVEMILFTDQENEKKPYTTPQSSSIDPPEQHWNKTWGGIEKDTSLCIDLDSANNVYVIGTCDITTDPLTSADRNLWYQPPSSETSGDIVLLKYDSDGVFQWNKTWGGDGKDTGRAIVVDSDNIYVVGDSADGDIVFLKYDSSGELLWDKSWSSFDIAYAIAIDSEGNILITGRDDSGDLTLWKFDSLGAQLWERTWGEEGSETGWAVATDSSNNVYVTGLMSLYNGEFVMDLFLVKFSSSGQVQWSTTWGGSEFDDAHSIAIDSSDNIFVSGCCISFGAGGNDLSIVKFNNAGQLQWNRTWGGSENEWGWDILTLDASDNIYLGAGTNSFGAGADDGVLVKFNSMGEQQWNTTWGGSGSESFGSLVVDSEENIYLTGTTDSFGAGGEDIFLVKYSYTPFVDSLFDIPGYNVFGILGCICLVSIISIKKWRKA